jgi:hypothetical protein
MLHSDYRELCSVTLPYAERQMYMHTFDLSAPTMPSGFEDYLEPVRGLCAAAHATHGLAHLTVDEKVVEAGMSQRRPKPHVDGCFIPAAASWGHPGWAHGCSRRMPVIVAASAPGCRVWRGVFHAQPASDGDLSHLDLPDGEILPADIGYLLSADCVHESLVQSLAVRRTFLRIALPTDFQFA